MAFKYNSFEVEEILYLFDKLREFDLKINKEVLNYKKLFEWKERRTINSAKLFSV